MLQQYGFVLIWVALLAWFWFKILKPQREKQKDVANLQQNVAIGDRIVTIGGIVGVVTYVGDTDFNIDVNGVVLTFKKWAIGSSETTTVEDLQPVESIDLEEPVEPVDPVE